MSDYFLYRGTSKKRTPYGRGVPVKKRYLINLIIHYTLYIIQIHYTLQQHILYDFFDFFI
jgi:hypothetical protein